MSSSSDIDGSTTVSDFSEVDIEKTKKRKLPFQDFAAAAGYVCMLYYDTYLNKKRGDNHS